MMMQIVFAALHQPHNNTHKPLLPVFLHTANARNRRLSYMRKTSFRPQRLHTGLEMVPPAQTGRSTGHGTGIEGEQKIFKAS
jgi:hypothetical protein